MSDLPPALPEAPAPGVGRIIGGVAFAIMWAAAHVVLFYLFAGGGIVLDILLGIAKTVMVPGREGAHHIDFDQWAMPLRTGLFIAGAAGIPAGIAIIWRHKRKAMMRLFWLALVVGVGFELFALGNFVMTSLSL